MPKPISSRTLADAQRLVATAEAKARELGAPSNVGEQDQKVAQAAVAALESEAH